MRATVRRTALLMAVALLAAACGQKPGVHDRAVAEGEQFVLGPGSDGTLPGEALPTDGASPGATTGPGSGGTPDGGGQDDSGGTDGPVQGDTTGVSANEIVIGIHAPLSGAAPISPTSFRTGKDLYWNRGNNGGPVTIHGRRVRVVFADDHYNPQYAVSVCQQMAEQQKAFLLIGGGGTDQIQACAQYANARGIPYLSAGVTEAGVSAADSYFAVSMTYPAQARLLARYVVNRLGGKGKRVAAVIANTPNFDDAKDAFVGSMQSLGVKVTVFQPGKDDNGTSMSQNLCTGTIKKFDIVFALMAPSHFLEMAGASKCAPEYVGVGVSMGLDEVADIACGTGGYARDGQAHFFSPAPAFASAGSFDSGFARAGGSDDIQFLLWGISKVLHQMFDRAGQGLSREGFIQTLETNFKGVKTNVFPDLTFSTSSHFGANQVYVLKNDCSGGSGRYVLETPTRQSSF